MASRKAGGGYYDEEDFDDGYDDDYDERDYGEDGYEAYDTPVAGPATAKVSQHSTHLPPASSTFLSSETIVLNFQ